MTAIRARAEAKSADLRCIMWFERPRMDALREDGGSNLINKTFVDLDIVSIVLDAAHDDAVQVGHQTAVCSMVT